MRPAGEHRSAPRERRRVVVNADDLGLSPGVNQGIAAAHEDGIVTSASLMVAQPAAEEAARWARARPHLSVGIHVDLGEWRFRGGEWEAVYERTHPDDDESVAEVVDAQLARFHQLMGRPPTHVDSHQHVHRHGAAGAVVAARAAALGVPLRERSPVAYVGGFYGQGHHGDPLPHLISVAALCALVAGLGPGWSELGCHPGFAEDCDSAYGAERRIEVQALCDPRVRRCLDDNDVELATFGEAP